MSRILIAGVGNIFLGDDGFGVEVAARLVGKPLPGGVRVRDFGIRGVHLAYELLNGYDGLVLVDAVARGSPPGTVYVIEPYLAAIAAIATTAAGEAAMDGHSMSPDTVLVLIKTLGADLGQLYVVGCEPSDIGERIGLSAPVQAAVEQATTVVRDLVAQMVARSAIGSQIVDV